MTAKRIESSIDLMVSLKTEQNKKGRLRLNHAGSSKIVYESGKAKAKSKNSRAHLTEGNSR